MEGRLHTALMFGCREAFRALTLNARRGLRLLATPLDHSGSVLLDLELRLW